MKPNLFQAIDRIGDRLAARLDWETTSGLPWGELQPYLAPAPGKLAREVLDPGDPTQMLVAWHRKDAKTILESQEIPAHRDPLEVDPDFCVLHRLNVAKLGADLAGTFGFIPSPAKNSRDFHRIGMVQVPNHATVDVFLLIPQTPGSAKLAAQRLWVDRGEKETIMLLPTARWMAILPAFPRTFEIRVLVEFLLTEESDSLLAVAADAAPKRKAKPQLPVKSLQVRQDDKWHALAIVLNPSNGVLDLRIGDRRAQIRVWDTKVSPPHFVKILTELALKDPQVWSIHDVSAFKQQAKRRAFQRMRNRLVQIAPVQDGDPFRYDPVSHQFTPKFALSLADAQNLSWIRR
jgi:hypothetical protein